MWEMIGVGPACVLVAANSESIIETIKVLFYAILCGFGACPLDMVLIGATILLCMSTGCSIGYWNSKQEKVRCWYKFGMALFATAAATGILATMIGRFLLAGT